MGRECLPLPSWEKTQGQGSDSLPREIMAGVSPREGPYAVTSCHQSCLGLLVPGPCQALLILLPPSTWPGSHRAAKGFVRMNSF